MAPYREIRRERLIDKILPPVVVGRIITGLVLSLAGTAVGDVMYKIVGDQKVYGAIPTLLSDGNPSLCYSLFNIYW